MDLTFFTGLPNFIGPIAEHFGRSPDNKVKVFVNGDQSAFMNALQTAEVAWFDFANEMLIAAQNMYRYKTFKCIVRLHSYEAFSDFPTKIDWSRVDHLILVNESVRDVLDMQGMWDPIAKNVKQIHIIPNLIDTNRFQFHDIFQKNLNKIAYVGHINYKKDPSMILPIAERLKDTTIHCAGEIQDLRYQLIFDKIKQSNKVKNIVFEGHQNAISNWLRDKGYILNTSLFESFNLAICEGMLCGCLPLVRNWHGSENIYPNIEKWDTIEDCISLIDKHKNTSKKELSEIQKSNRKFVIDNYDSKVLIPKIEKIVL